MVHPGRDADKMISMKRYLLLMRNHELEVDAMSEPDWSAMFERFIAWTEDLERRGRLHAVERLLDPAAGRTVGRKHGKLLVDGPYAEGKEAIVGLYVIAAENEDDAVRIAQEAPLVDLGGLVEVRELGDFPRPAR